jgi:hypothetical protein
MLAWRRSSHPVTDVSLGGATHLGRPSVPGRRWCQEALWIAVVQGTPLSSGLGQDVLQRIQVSSIFEDAGGMVP